MWIYINIRYFEIPQNCAGLSTSSEEDGYSFIAAAILRPLQYITQQPALCKSQILKEVTTFLSLQLLLAMARCRLTTTTLLLCSSNSLSKIICQVSSFKVAKKMDAHVSVFYTGKIQDDQDRTFQFWVGLVNNEAHNDLSWFSPLLEGNSSTFSSFILKMSSCCKAWAESSRSSYDKGEMNLVPPTWRVGEPFIHRSGVY
jgi:hypothetical protein